MEIRLDEKRFQIEIWNQGVLISIFQCQETSDSLSHHLSEFRDLFKFLEIEITVSHTKY